MNPGRELDALIAEKVMGIDVERIIHGFGIADGDINHYSTDISAAWEVFQVMRKKYFSERRNFMIYLQEIVSGFSGLNSTEHLIAWPDVFWYVTPHAICLAAMKAMGIDYAS